jgi:hypothetical protein
MAGWPLGSGLVLHLVPDGVYGSGLKMVQARAHDAIVRSRTRSRGDEEKNETEDMGMYEAEDMGMQVQRLFS